MHPSVNVNGTELQPCSTDPMTGWYRDGCCNTDANDRGSHVVCCTLTEDFLLFAKSQGNDLMTLHNMDSLASSRAIAGVCAPRLGWMQPMQGWLVP